MRQNLAIGQRRLAIQDFLNLLPKRIRSGAYDAAFARHVWIILAILGRQQIVFGDWVRRSSLVEQWSTNIHTRQVEHRLCRSARSLRP